MHHPYASLDPDLILSALESLGLYCSGSLLALNSYENRVYQVGMDEGPPLIAKFYRPERWSAGQILEEHAFCSELMALEIPVVGALAFNGQTLQSYQGFQFAVFPRRGGRAPELENRDTLEWLGRFLGRIHAVGATRPFTQRPTLNAETFGDDSLHWLAEHAAIPPELRSRWLTVASEAMEGVRACYQRAGSPTLRRLHGDCHPSNVLWTDAGPHFVDFDDARMGPAVQDIWMLLSGERRDKIGQLADLLAGYEDFCEFDPRELHLLEALRTLRQIHYSAWLARRWDDPAFPLAFPWFAGSRYWEEQIVALQNQRVAMEEPPLW